MLPVVLDAVAVAVAVAAGGGGGVAGGVAGETGGVVVTADSIVSYCCYVVVAAASF